MRTNSEESVNDGPPICRDRDLASISSTIIMGDVVHNSSQPYIATVAPTSRGWYILLSIVYNPFYDYSLHTYWE